MREIRAEAFFLLADVEVERLVKEIYDRKYDAFHARGRQMATQWVDVCKYELDATDLQNWGRPNPHRTAADVAYVQPDLENLLNDMAFRREILPGLYLLGSLPPDDWKVEL